MPKQTLSESMTQIGEISVNGTNMTATICKEAFGWNRLTGKPMGAHLYVSLTLFVVVEYISAALCQTINFPVGVFMPVFMVGAAFGRLVGESMFAWFPSGFGKVRLMIQDFVFIREP